ncbi:MAG: hypothetical protein KF752_00720 [Pirellulaceae bacterium]|nr:hypothetical protein [Pirellulaceae bacterium]
MSNDNYDLGKSSELAKRKDALKLFLERMFDEEDRPYLVADEACTYDIFAGVDSEFVIRCLDTYGYRMTESDFRLPVWKLLDKLDQAGN